MIAQLFNRLRVRARALFRSHHVEHDLHQELRGHIDRHIEELIADGVPVDAARAEALRVFGGLAQAEEACRDARGVRRFTELSQDLRYGLRMMRRTPGPAAIIILTLAVAIGANTALFGVFDAVLLKALPLPNPDRVVIITEETPTVRGGPVSYPDFLDFRARQTTFEDLAVSMVIGGILTGGGEAERVFGRAVSREFFATLGSGFEIGRTFSTQEDRPGGERAVVLNHALWQRRYHGDRGVLGRPMTAS